MLRLSTKIRYGSRVMILLGLQYPDPLSVREMSEVEGLSNIYLEQIILPLKNAGLLRSIRGAGGGFSLIKPPDQIKMSEIVRVLEGSWNLVECVENENYCEKSQECATIDLWSRLFKGISEILENTTLADMIQIHKKKNRKSKQ